MQANLTSGAFCHKRFGNARFLAVRRAAVAALAFVVGMTFNAGPAAAAQSDGSGEVTITGELKHWHKVTLTLDGPWARESDEQPNPFTDYRLTVTFRHESGSPQYVVPGYFAADGDAANSSADSGTKWRAHLSPDKTGRWTYHVSLVQGKHAALDPSIAGKPLARYDGKTGSFGIAATDKTGRDFRGEGRLQYIGKHHLRFAGSGRYFLKAGADAPETLLAYADFDGTHPGKTSPPRPGEATPGKDLHRYEPHLRDWRPGDPTWKDGKGKGLIGALDYLAAKGCNAFSFFHDIRKATLWGTIMAGGAGVEYYFGYKLPQNDLVCEDFRSRDQSWDYCRIALDFFREHEIPFWEMTNADALIGNAKNNNSRYCLAKPGSVYLVYLPTGGTAEIDLSGVSGTFTVQWFDPRHGGPLQAGSVRKVSGGSKTALGTPPKDAHDDWLIVILGDKMP